MLSGLAVLLVLLGGQVIGTWHARPPADVANVSNAQARATTPPPVGDPVPGPAGSPPSAGPGELGPGSPRPSVEPTRRPSRAQALAAMGVKRVTGSRRVALTFDDGPHPHHTAQVLALLRQHRVKAVFCLVGTEVRRYPQLVAQIAREGHTLCNHSWHHELELGKWPAAKIRDNLERTSLEIRRAVPNARIPYFRQPGGLWTPAVVKAAREQRMTPLDWTVDPADWKKPPAKAITSRVIAQAKPGSVVLLHDAGGDRAGTVTACRTIIPTLKQRFGLVQLR